MKKIAVVLMILAGSIGYLNGNATTTICPGSGVSCKVSTTIEGVTYTVTSEKDKDKGAVVIE